MKIAGGVFFLLLLSLSVPTFAWGTPPAKPPSCAIAAGQTLSLELSLDAGEVAGLDADWWLVMVPPDGSLYSFSLATMDFVEGLSPVFGGPLLNVAPFSLPVPSPPVSGVHQFYFGVDTDMNGSLDVGQLWFCFASIDVKPDDGGDWKWSLWNSGQTMLRGANVHQRKIYPSFDGTEFLGPGPLGPPHTQEDFDRLAAMGANYVNISHPGLYTEYPPYEVDTDNLDNLDRLLAMIAEADMFAVISFRTGPGRSEFAIFPGETWYDQSAFLNTVWTDGAAQAAWADMWRFTAGHYRDNPVVVGYDLMVEPNPADTSLGQEDFEPTDFYPRYADTLYDWNQLAPRISSAIREVDQDTPILVGAMGYSAIVWFPYLVPTGDAKTVYVVHQYEPQEQYTHQEAGGTSSYPGYADLDWDGSEEVFDRSYLEDLMSIVDGFAAANGVPIAVNEFGLYRWEPGADLFMNDLMGLFEDRRMNHALWYWQPSWPSMQVEENAFNFRAGPDPENIADLATSALMTVIRNYWERNTVRPSNVLPSP